jgi:hypothetical protein
MDEPSVSFCSKGRCQFLVALAPPEVLQAAPELMRLLDATNFLAARGFGFGSELLDDAAQRGLEAFGELLVVRAEGRGGIDAEGRGVRGARGRSQRRRRDAGDTKTGRGAEADCAGPSMGTIEASGLAV